MDIAVNQDSFEEAVSRLNTAISDFDLEIRKTLSQTNGNPLWAIVCLLVTNLMKGEYHIRLVLATRDDTFTL
jgi:hypothetical protein